jgi:hypothetical protein
MSSKKHRGASSRSLAALFLAVEFFQIKQFAHRPYLMQLELANCYDFGFMPYERQAGSCMAARRLFAWIGDNAGENE